MIRFFFTRFILPLLLFLLLRYILKVIAETFRSTTPQTTHRQAPNFRGGELKKDPVCGTYVSPEAAFTRTVKGQVLHFCSADCRDRYSA